jgi:hypothetical protein
MKFLRGGAALKKIKRIIDVLENSPRNPFAEKSRALCRPSMLSDN